MTYHLELRRRTLFYMMNFILPCVLIAVLTLLVFLLPPESGERMSFGVTVLLSFTILLLMLMVSKLTKLSHCSRIIFVIRTREFNHLFGWLSMTAVIWFTSSGQITCHVKSYSADCCLLRLHYHWGVSGNGNGVSYPSFLPSWQFFGSNSRLDQGNSRSSCLDLE